MKILYWHILHHTEILSLRISALESGVIAQDQLASGVPGAGRVKGLARGLNSSILASFKP